jgi:hypothetical protein
MQKLLCLEGKAAYASFYFIKMADRHSWTGREIPLVFVGRVQHLEEKIDGKAGDDNLRQNHGD